MAKMDGLRCGNFRAGSHSDGSRHLPRALHVELDVLPFLEAVEIKLLKATAVEEDLPAIIGMDEPESRSRTTFLIVPCIDGPSIVVKRGRHSWGLFRGAGGPP